MYPIIEIIVVKDKIVDVINIKKNPRENLSNDAQGKHNTGKENEHNSKLASNDYQDVKLNPDAKSENEQNSSRR